MSKQAKITINQVKIILVNPDKIVFLFPLLVYLYQKHFIWINTESPQLDGSGSERRKSEHRKVKTSRRQLDQNVENRKDQNYDVLIFVVLTLPQLDFF
jgi:hypothetical protein